MLVAAEPIEQDGRQLGEVQEAVADLGFDIAMRGIGSNESWLFVSTSFNCLPQ